MKKEMGKEKEKRKTLADLLMSASICCATPLLSVWVFDGLCLIPLKLWTTLVLVVRERCLDVGYGTITYMVLTFIEKISHFW